MEESLCRTCSARRLPDIVEPCKSCNRKSNWRQNIEPHTGIYAKRPVSCGITKIGVRQSPEVTSSRFKKSIVKTIDNLVVCD